MMSNSLFLQPERSLRQRILHLNWGLVFLIICIAGVGIASLYSAAGGSFSPWAERQIARFLIGMLGMFIIALIDIKWWYKLSWPIYFAGFFLLVLVEIMGQIGMGAQRWINLGFMQLQPSELMKVAVVMALARHFHGASPEDARRLTFLVVPTLLILAPVGLVLLQPDLGTSLMIVMVGAAMIFLAGAPIKLFVFGIIAALSSIPIGWQFLHDYQKQRVLTFLNPESDPLGAGYHITQSKIALGSGGIQGKGFLQGTQSHLNFFTGKAD